MFPKYRYGISRVEPVVLHPGFDVVVVGVQDGADLALEAGVHDGVRQVALVGRDALVLGRVEVESVGRPDGLVLVQGGQEPFRAFAWPERCGEALADDREVAEVADLPRVHTGRVVDLPAVADRADDLLSDAERLREQPRLLIRFDQPGGDPEQEPLDAEVLIGARPVLGLSSHAACGTPRSSSM